MEQNPFWKAKTHSALMKPKVSLWHSQEPAMVSILAELIQSTPFNPSYVRCSLILSSIYACHPNDFFPSGVQIKILHAFHIPLMHTTCPAEHVLIALIVLLIFGAEHIIMKLLVQFSPISCHSFLLGPIILSTLL